MRELKEAAYAMLATITIDSAKMDDALQFLNGFTIPAVKQGDGFISGTWMRSKDGNRGHSILLYETEAAAQAAADRARQGPPPGAPIQFVSAEVFEVVAQT